MNGPISLTFAKKNVPRDDRAETTLQETVTTDPNDAIAQATDDRNRQTETENER